MTRALGPVRELDVALTHLEELANREIVSTRALSYVRQEIARERLERRRELLAAITPGKIDKLRQQLGHVATGPETPTPARGHRARAAAGDPPRAEADGRDPPRRRSVSAGSAASRARRGQEAALCDGSRIASCSRSRSTARIGQLKRLQDVLGCMHDFEILIDRTRHVQALIAATDRALATELDALVRTLEDECRQQHATYMRRRAALLKLCEALSPGEPQHTAVA